MNSYQTANAAFRAAGLGSGAGVRHGRGYFFRKALVSSVVGRMARDLQFDYTETKIANGRAKEQTLHGMRKGGIAAAKAGGTSWLTHAVQTPKARIQVRYAKRGQAWDVVDTSVNLLEGGYVLATFEQLKWAQFTAEAWNEGWTPAKYGLVKGIDTSEYTLA